VIAFAGPLTHFPQAAFWLILMAMSNKGHIVWFYPCYANELARCIWINLLAGAIKLQIALFCFNLFLPAYPLDGGRLLADFMLIRGVEVNRAAKITAGVSVPIGLAVMAYGFATSSTFDAGSAITIFAGEEGSE
jgi:hypothetical protein